LILGSTACLRLTKSAVFCGLKLCTSFHWDNGFVPSISCFEEVLEKEKSANKTIRERQKNWIGHVLSGDSSCIRYRKKEWKERKKVVGRLRT